MYYAKENEEIDYNDQLAQDQKFSLYYSGIEFAKIIEYLPVNLKLFNNFSQVFMPKSEKNFYLKQEDVIAAGDAGKEFLDYGMSPVVFFTSINAIELLIKKLARSDHTSIENGYLKLVVDDKTINVSKNYIKSFLDLKSIPEKNQDIMVSWILDVIKLKPKLLKNIHIDSFSNDCLVVQLHKKTAIDIVKNFDENTSWKTQFPNGETIETKYPPKFIKKPKESNDFKQKLIDNNFIGSVLAFSWLIGISFIFLYHFILMPILFLNIKLQQFFWNINKKYKKHNF